MIFLYILVSDVFIANAGWCDIHHFRMLTNLNCCEFIPGIFWLQILSCDIDDPDTCSCILELAVDGLTGCLYGDGKCGCFGNVGCVLNQFLFFHLLNVAEPCLFPFLFTGICVIESSKPTS